MLPYINAPFVFLADKIGASPDELKLITSFLLSYPFAGLLKRVPDAKPAYKNLFIISVSLFYLVGLFDLWSGLRTVLISSAGAYAIAKYLRGSPYMPWIGFVFVMGHMSVNQLARQFANTPSVVDITAAQMVLVLKITAFCWNVADGTLPEEQLSDFQKDRALRELPGLLDYAGFVFFFPGFMAGPAFDYAEYRRWIDTSMFDIPANVDPAKRPPTRKARRIPRSGTPATLKAVSGLLWVFAFLKLSGYYYPQSLIEPEYLNYGFVRRVFIMHMVGFTTRCKYYGVWSLTEGACILAGIGYNGVDPKTGRVSWNRAQNIIPWSVETAQNTRGYLEGWNIKTNSWLRNYVYLRVTPRGKKPGFRASMATFVTSAIWHGFYPGYYLTFVLASLVQTVAKNFRRHVRPFFLNPATQQPLPSKRYYDFFSYVTTQLTFAFIVVPFVILGLGDSILAWSRVYFYGIGGALASIAFFASPAKALLRKRLQERAARAGVVSSGAKPEAGGAGAGTAGAMHKSASTESLRGPMLGVSPDLEGEFEEMKEEVRQEIEKIQRERRASMAKKSK